MEAARNGLKFFKQLQAHDGHFPAEYSGMYMYTSTSTASFSSLADQIGPLFLLPGLVIAMYVTGQSFKPEQITEMRRYLLNVRRKEGGWGL